MGIFSLSFFPRQNSLLSMGSLDLIQYIYIYINFTFGSVIITFGHCVGVNLPISLGADRLRGPALNTAACL